MAVKRYTFKLNWTGPGWYTGSFTDDTTIIVEKSPNGGPDAIAIDDGQGAVFYAEPPRYMQPETERK